MRVTRYSAGVLLACSTLLTVACGGDDDGSSGGMDAGRDSSTPACSTTGPENTAAACMDSCDNDADDFADCDDRDCCGARSDCPATTFCGRPDGGNPDQCATPGDEVTQAACSNECDDDGNGFVDCDDFACCDIVTCGADTGCGRRGDAGMPMVYTIEQLQNRADPMHPAPATRVTVMQEGMIALTGRVLVGSATGGASRTCRWAVWVGAAESGEHTAIQVQESMMLPEGTERCFDLPPGKISPDFAPGDAVTAINSATYNEFCASAQGSMPNPCTDFEQSNIFLGGSATIVRGAAGTAPTGTLVEVADLVGAAGAPGPDAVALEGGLLRVEDVRIKATMEGSFTRYSAYAADAPTVELDVVVSNFPATGCVRPHFDMLAMGTTTTDLTGILLPNFGRWSLRIRNEADVAGLTCE